MTYQLLLILHIIGGAAALLTAVGAVAIKWLDLKHLWHVYAGRVYVIGMTVVFITAILMAIIRPNLFLFLIALFSFYLVFAGWRYAQNRSGKPGMVDWGSIFIMLITAVGMLIFGALRLMAEDGDGVTLVVFALIGGGFALFDTRMMRSGIATGKRRIAMHLSLMLGGTIATITAVVVVNFEFEPAFVLWLAPTVLIVPLIIFWNRKILQGA